MKKISFLCAILALALVSCNRMEPAAPALRTVKIEASVDGATKTAIVEGKTTSSFVWSDDDASRFLVQENGVDATEVTLDLANDNRNATISATFPNATADEYVYTASMAKNRLASNKAPRVPAVQVSTETSYDPDADILVAESRTFSEPQTELKMNFTRPVVINRVVLSGLPADKTFNSVIISSDKDLVGNYIPNSGNWTGGGKMITVNIEPTSAPDRVLTVYFVSRPGTDISLTFKVMTTDNQSFTKVFARTVSLQATNETILYVDMTGIDPVTDYSGTVVFTDKNVTRMAVTYSSWQYPNTNKRWIEAADVTFADGKIYYDPEDENIPDIALAKFNLIRNDDPESDYYGMYLIENKGNYIFKDVGDPRTDPGMPGLRGSSGFIESMANQFYWEIDYSNGKWTVVASMAEPEYASYLTFTNVNGSNCLYATKGANNICIHRADVLEAAAVQ